MLVPQATFVPNLVSFATSIAKLAHGEESHTQSLIQLIGISVNSWLENAHSRPLFRRAILTS